MTSKTLALVIAAAVLGGAAPMRAQTAPDLLQKGIYLQETMGDLDGAIKAYRQVAQLAQGSRPSAAQALYRLGVCLGKKNQEAEAAQTFQKVIDEYPEQTDVVEKARALLPSGLKLLPAPWADGEILDFAASMGSNMNLPAGTLKMRYSVRSSKTNPTHWILESRIYSPFSMALMQVEAHGDTLKPVASRSNNPMFPGHTSYQGSEARVELNGKAPRTVKLEGPVFDADELVCVLRRLPLTNGYKTSLHVLTSASSEVSKMAVAVVGEEDVKTPAGQFHAYRVELNGSATYWISTDPSRYLVKTEQGAMMSSELSAIRRADQSSIYHNGEFGFSLSVPAGWTAEEASLGAMTDGKKMVQLVDSDSSALVTLTVEPRKLKTEPTVEGMRKEVERNTTQPAFPPQKMRTDSLQDKQVGGHPALSWIADGTGMMDKSPVIAYTVWVRSTALKAEFSAKVDPQEFARLQPLLEAIINSLTLK
jgi:hypothetical protein